MAYLLYTPVHLSKKYIKYSKERQLKKNNLMSFIQSCCVPQLRFLRLPSPVDGDFHTLPPPYFYLVILSSPFNYFFVYHSPAVISTTSHRKPHRLPSLSFNNVVDMTFTVVLLWPMSKLITTTTLINSSHFLITHQICCFRIYPFQRKWRRRENSEL